VRKEATDYGVACFVQEMLQAVGTELDGTTAVVSAAGNVAVYAIEKVTQLGGQREEITVGIRRLCHDTADEYGAPGDYVLGGNAAGFTKVAPARASLGLI
jgi:glutamate dehydrogenase/leucine dehydrogenase